MDNIIKNDYIKALEGLKIYDTDHQYKFQQAYLPAVNSFKLKVVTSYKYMGEDVRYNPNKIYLLADLPITNRYKREAKIMSLLEAVDNKLIKPFIIFQDSKYLNWDYVSVVFDWSSTYLIIDKNSESLQFDTITFPYDIIINDYSTIFDINDRTLFMFNKDGFYINYGRFKRHLKNKSLTNDETNFGINAEWPDYINSEKLEPGGTVDGEDNNDNLWLNTIRKAYSIFPDGSEIEDDSIYNHPGDTYIMISMKKSNDKLLHFTGRYVNWYSNMYIDGLDREYLIGPNNFVCFDKDGKLSIDSIEVNEFNEFKLKDIGMYFDMFYYTFNNKSLNNSLRIKNLYVQEAAEKLCPDIPLLKDPLNIKFDRNKSYEENIYDNKDKLYYNPEIISAVNDKHTPINTINLKGSDLLKARKNDGCVHLFRGYEHETEDCFVMIFVNGELLRDNYKIKYNYNSVLVPVDSIKITDDIEIVYFHHIDNRYFDITLGEDGYSLSNLSNDINVDDIELYSKDSPKGFIYNIKNKPNVYVEVDYEIQDNTIKPIDPYYNGRPVVMASSKQFHHYSYYANQLGLRIKLPKQFDFCNKKENYIVFINGRKQNDFHFTEMTDTRPFYDKAIYLHKMYDRGDIIDIFYLPYKSDILDVEIDKYGNIISDENLYFSKNVSLLFVNGKKVPHSEIAQIPMDGLRVIKDYKSMKNVSLIKLEEPSYNERYYSELWDAVNNLPETIKDELLWLPVLGNTPENDTIHIKREMGIKDEGFDNSSVGAVFASMINKIEKHRSILMTGRMLNGLEMKVVERSKNSIDDIESDMCSDELTPSQVIYEIIKDYYVAPDMMKDKNIYSNKFFYDYDSRILDFDDKVLNPENDVDIFIIRLLSAYKFDKAPQEKLIK